MTLTGTRKAFLSAVLGASAFGGLLALEYTGSSASTPPTTVIDSVNQAEAGQSAEHTRHCTDGKGMDAEKNKHCRDVSGAQ